MFAEAARAWAAISESEILRKPCKASSNTPARRSAANVLVAARLSLTFHFSTGIHLVK